MNIALCGFMGAGKTAVGRQLSKMAGMEFVDTDELVESRQGIPVSEIFEKYGDKHFRELEYEVCRGIAQRKNCVISTGGGAMTFKRNVEALKQSAVIVFIDTPFDVICERIGNPSNRPLFRNKESARKLFFERRSLYIDAADHIVDGNQSVRNISLQILKLVK